MKLRVFVFLVAVVFALGCSGVAWSQTVQGVITGVVTDPSGAVVPNASVTLTNAGTNISQSTTTGSDGSYRFSLVPPGTYTIEVKAGSFATVRASGLVVEASQIVPYNVKLELAKAQQVIEVTSQAPLVQTASSDLGYQVNSSTIEHAALVDRDIFDVLPFMAPAVTPGLDMTATSGGAREAGTSYMLNGAEDNNNFSAGALNINPPLETVEDFSLIQNVMGAQYGRGMGEVVSANQKSGTNKFHAVLYEQNRNATLNANDFFYNRDYGNALGTANPLPKRPKYIKNQFGGTVGGPIRKDKTFFFFGFDRLKLLQGFTAADNFEPTSTALAGIQANAGPIAKQILAAYPPITSDLPCPNISGTGGTNLVGCLSVSDPLTTTTNSYYGRVDQNFSNSDRLSFSANVSRFIEVDKFGFGIGEGGSILAGFKNIPGTNTVNQHNLSLIETHTFSPRVANELILSHNRYFNPTVEGNPAQQTAPEVTIDNLSSGNLGYSFGPLEGGQIVAFTQDRWALQDNLSWTVGRHALKIGGSANYGILYRNWDLGLPGNYEFAEPFLLSNGTNSTGCAPGTNINPVCDGTQNPADGTILANCPGGVCPTTNFAGDYPYFQETSIDPRTGLKADAYRHYTSHDYSVFAQDDWKVTSRLTMNLGLRWERFGAPSEDHGNIAQFTNLGGCNWATDRACIKAARVGQVSRMWNTQNHDFGPRIGFAYDPFGKGTTAIRGGYGIFYDRIFDNIWSNGAWNPPFYALIDFSAGCGDSVFYQNPPSVGAAYNTANPIPHPGARVSVRTMDVNMHDSSGQNYYFGVEHQFFGGLLLSAKYQGSMGRHLPMLQNVNRTDGQGYNYDPTGASCGTASGSNFYNANSTICALLNKRPNSLYTGFNYRANNVSSNYNALILEATKHMGHGLQFDTSYTFSKLLDVNSELFAGCSGIGSRTAPYYFISNALPRLTYGPGAFDRRHNYKFNVTYDLPFLKSEKGFAGHALGGWSLGSFFQFYSGHPIDVYSGSCIRYPGYDASGNPILDQNNIPFNIGNDYNNDGVCNEKPMFVGSNMKAVYSNGSPADGIFKDNNQIGCGFPGMPGTIGINAIQDCNATFGVAGACPSLAFQGLPATCVPSVGTPNAMFANIPYPGGATPFERFTGSIGRDVFHGPRFVDMDLGVHKTFKLTETMNLRFSAEAQNVLNHPNFDGVQGNLDNARFGQAELLVGAAASRVMSLSLRLAF